MSTIKTAISVEGELFREAESLARRMKVSRSKLFATAMAEFIERRRNRRLLQAIDAACTPPDRSEKKLQRAMRGQHRKRIVGQW